MEKGFMSGSRGPSLHKARMERPLKKTLVGMCKGPRVESGGPVSPTVLGEGNTPLWTKHASCTKQELELPIDGQLL